MDEETLRTGLPKHSSALRARPHQMNGNPLAFWSERPDVAKRAVFVLDEAQTTYVPRQGGSAEERVSMRHVPICMGGHKCNRRLLLFEWQDIRSLP